MSEPTKQVMLTEREAKHILADVSGPERKGMQPTDDEKQLGAKMIAILAEFAADSRPTDDEWLMIKAQRAARAKGAGEGQ